MSKLSHKFLGRWHVSLPAKITIIVFWGLVIIGFIASLLLLNGVEQQLSDYHTSTIDQAAYRLEQYLKYNPKTSTKALETRLNEIRKALNIDAMLLEHQANSYVVGKKKEGLVAYTRSIQFHATSPRHSHETNYLSVYLPDLQNAVNHRRKNLLLGMGILFVAFGMSLALVLQNILTKPFLRMLNVADEITQGKTELRFDVEREDEFGYLGKFINRVLEKLLKQKTDLQTALDQVKKSEAALYEQKERAEITLHSIGDAVITTRSRRTCGLSQSDSGKKSQDGHHMRLPGNR